jgi:2-oxoglutarate ferredoxin oxidoreductase subunit alpha
MDADLIAANRVRLMQKVEQAVEDITFFEAYDFSSAKTLVITYGVTARAVKAALLERERREKVAVLVLKTLWPVPEKLIRTKSASHDRIVVAEMNLGQYVREIQRVLPHKRIDFLGQMNGELIKPDLIIEVIDHG